MLMLDRRLQILIDEERYRRLEREAARRKVAVAVLVREAIDGAFPAERSAKATAGRRILDAEPMSVPDPAALRRELDERRGR